MFKKIFYLTFFSVFILTSCSTPAASSTPSKVVPTQTLLPTETFTPEPSSTPMPPTATLTVEPLKGLGITKDDVLPIFKLLEFEFATETNDKGLEVYKGTISDDLAVVTIIGPAGNLSSISIRITVPLPPTQKQSARTMAYLSATLSAAANDWKDGPKWLSDSLEVMGTSKTTYLDRDIVLKVTPGEKQMTVDFTISAK